MPVHLYKPRAIFEGALIFLEMSQRIWRTASVTNKTPPPPPPPPPDLEIFPITETSHRLPVAGAGEAVASAAADPLQRLLAAAAESVRERTLEAQKIRPSMCSFPHCEDGYPSVFIQMITSVAFNEFLQSWRSSRKRRTKRKNINFPMKLGSIALKTPPMDWRHHSRSKITTTRPQY